MPSRTLTDVIEKQCTRGKWRSEDTVGPVTGHPNVYRKVFHYSTVMLIVFLMPDGSPIREDWGIHYKGLGYGTVSDQQGMNRLFRALKSSYYYSRAGGASIEERLRTTARRLGIVTNP